MQRLDPTPIVSPSSPASRVRSLRSPQAPLTPSAGGEPKAYGSSRKNKGFPMQIEREEKCQYGGVYSHLAWYKLGEQVK